MRADGVLARHCGSFERLGGGTQHTVWAPHNFEQTTLGAMSWVEHRANPHISQLSTSPSSTWKQGWECSTGDQTIILGLTIFLDHRSSWTLDQEICPPSPPFFDLRSWLEVIWMSWESYSSSFRPLISLLFCLFVFSSSIVHLSSLWFTVKQRGIMSSQDGAYVIMIKTKYLCKSNYLDAYSRSNHLFIF